MIVRPSCRMLKMGCQYTPVDSMATTLISRARSHSSKASRVTGHCRKGARLLLQTPIRLGDQGRGHCCLLMHIDCGTPLIHYVHNEPPLESRCLVSLPKVRSAGCQIRTRFLRVLVATVIHSGRTPVSFCLELEASL